MSIQPSVIVERAIRHARIQARAKTFEWPTARKALTSILTDLETTSPGDPSLDKLRAFIEEAERVLARDRPRTSKPAFAAEALTRRPMRRGRL